MKKCYLCNCDLESTIDKETKNHKEHIIHQAIGGQLSVGGILCKECGGDKYLGGQIDKPFCDIFLPITTRIDIKKDRATKSVPIDGAFFRLDSDEKEQVTLKDGIMFSKIPHYKIDEENKKVHIYAKKDIAKNYINKVKKELGDSISENYEFLVISSFNDFLGIIEFNFNLNNEIFQLGMIKMAIEFALYNGIKLENITHFIDEKNRKLKCNGEVFPYYPVENIEKQIECLRLEKDCNFMSHSLVLFTQKELDEQSNEVKRLFCFIELFGTFQYFVLLKDNYKGNDVYETYSQRIIKEVTPEVKINSPKDILSYCDFLEKHYKNDNQNLAEIEKIKKDISDSKIVSDKLQNMYNKINLYKFDYTDERQRFIDRLKFHRDLNFPFYDAKSRFVFNKDNKRFSVICESCRLFDDDIEEFRAYTFFKFNELSKFIQNRQNSSKN